MMKDKFDQVRAEHQHDDVDTEVEPAIPAAKRAGIPTLKANVRRPETPMLASRFDYGDRWEGGPFHFEWLGLSDMEELWDSNHRIWRLIRDRRECWDNTPLAKTPDERISLFGVNEDDHAEVYLIWPESGEPQVLAYHGNYEYEFANLDMYLDWLIE